MLRDTSNIKKTEHTSPYGVVAVVFVLASFVVRAILSHSDWWLVLMLAAIVMALLSVGQMIGVSLINTLVELLKLLDKRLHR